MKKTPVRLALALLLSFSLLLPSFASQQEELESENAEYESRIEEQEEELEKLQEDIDEAEKYIEDIDEQIEEIEKEYSEAEEEIAALEDEINELTKYVEEEEEEMSQIYAMMSLRIQYFYESSQSNIIFEALECGSFAEALEALSASAELTSYDREQIDEIYQTVEDIEEKKASLEEAEATVEEKKEQCEARSVLLEELKDERQEYLQKAYSEEEDLEAELEELQAQYEKNSVQIDAIVAGYSEDAAFDLASMIWPLPSKYGTDHISSYFGYRVSTGSIVSSYHQGIDIYAPTGTEIYAVLDGTVVLSEYSSSCGYYVVIYHGSGIYTHYYHQCKASTLSVGDEVEQGEVIGYVGSTGNSTGSHLHFGITTEDIWEGYIDPIPYLELAAG